MTPKEQYEARKAERKKQAEAREYLSQQDEIGDQVLEILDRIATAFERIADKLESSP